MVISALLARKKYEEKYNRKTIDALVSSPVIPRGNRCELGYSVTMSRTGPCVVFLLRAA